MDKVRFGHSIVPYLFLLPQMVVVAVFFYLPAGEAGR